MDWLGSGTLLGSGSNSLSTNTIRVKAGAARCKLCIISTTPACADLILNGQLTLESEQHVQEPFLEWHFRLPVGTYTAAQLNANRFPDQLSAKYGRRNWERPTLRTFPGASRCFLQPAPTDYAIAHAVQPTAGYPGQTAQFTATAGGNIPYVSVPGGSGPTTNSFQLRLTTRTSVVPRRIR